MKSVLFIALFSISSAAYGQDLTHQQTDFIAKITGEWQIRKAYMDGDPLKGGLASKSVRISEGQMLFLMNFREKETPFVFTNVEAEAKRIEMTLEHDSKIHRYILHMDGDLMWLVTRYPGNSDLPEKLKPAKGNFCMALTRSKSPNASK